MFNNTLNIVFGLVFGYLFAISIVYFMWQIFKAKSAYFEVEEKYKGNQRLLVIIGIAIFALAINWVNNHNKIKLADTQTTPKIIALNTNKTEKSHINKKSKSHTVKKSHHVQKHH
jgi:ABC-type nickel/cobalt efflux system permease component RcnA